jgi:L-aspartate oxidase
VFSVDLCVENGRCAGVWVLDRGRFRLIRAGAVILATGGIGQAYWRTTNPAVATGDGLAMAYRAGAVLEDLEFVQFHPTALAVPGAPPFLLSEAMRGEGAILRNTAGEAFMARYDSRGELAPRDVVSQAIWEEMAVAGSDHVFLDVTALPRAWLLDRFPLIAKTCRRYGLDIAAVPIPVAPAAHFMIGGIKTDVRGNTSVPGLFAVGEAACTGVHGANRLASNSLLEGLVFGTRAGAAASAWARRRGGQAVQPAEPPGPVARADRALMSAIRGTVRRHMWDGVGIVRTASSIQRALEGLRREAWLDAVVFRSREALEVRNLRLVAELVAEAALQRRGSLGCHFRRDFPSRGTGWRRHISVSRP